MDKRGSLIVILVLVMIAFLTVLLVRSGFRDRVRQSEVMHNLNSIKTAMETYKDENGVYPECNFDSDIGASNEFDIGLPSERDFRYHYVVKTGDAGKSYTAEATADLDEDGKNAIYILDTKSSKYPEIIRRGDNY